jgi:predicted RNA-binding protein with RPS1 domain
MSGKPTIAEVAKVVMKTLADDFDNVKIVDVKVLDRTEDDEGITLSIQVVFEGKPKDLDARKVSSAVRRVRPALEEIGESGFPLFSFVTSSEAGFAPA